ncbi:MAG: hypothetical protein NWE75_03815 [Candidatus Bathyarchaeota archaeon]|nr:hypothetical protein [Candidatus Bathyarchaeota archaeon]
MDSSTLDILIGLAAVSVAAIAIYLFVRASGGTSKPESGKPSTKLDEREALKTTLPLSSRDSGEFKIPQAQRHLAQTDIEKARSSIRTLTLQREILSMVLKRLFDAEDEGEITGEERARLSKGYEDEMKQISEDLRQVELVVTLNELETIREDILKKFEETMNSTQAKIDSVLKELKLEREEAPQRAPPRRRRPAKKEEKPPEEEEEAEEGEERPERPRSDAEGRLEQLRMEVLKELEELEKLELEA